ncbi:hypothetical protein JT359_13400 [Candidatus Poribacteria bacterium]|nr:hypothetical protein [Candidatus Poribacteria bacterium]
MRIKSVAFIGVSISVLLLLVIVGMLVYFIPKSEQLNIQILDQVVKETMDENVALSGETIIPAEVSARIDSYREKIGLPENYYDLFDNSDLTSIQDLKKIQEMLNKYIEKLKAHGMYHPLREPDPTVEKAKQTIAEVDAFLVKSNREIEEQKKNVFEMSENIDSFTKETREYMERLDAWFARIDNKKSTNTSPSDTKRTPISTSTWQNDLDTYMTILDDDIVKKYPMATFVQSLSKEEIDTHFDTDSKSFLQSQQKQIVTDITQRVNQYLSENCDYRIDKINYIQEKLSKYWDADIVRQISSQLE